jgi:sugar O-acyltransferase (sialic acid O-acetyltransferase NeuD family)
MTGQASPVLIPLINPNEPEAILASLQVREGQHVSTGDNLCTLETTKSSFDLSAKSDGYITGLRFSQGQTARAGELFCYLSEIPDWVPPKKEAPEQVSGDRPSLPNGLRISQPALALARQVDLELSRLPIGPLVTEGYIRQLLAKETGPDLTPAKTVFDPTAILIYGGGGHGKSLIDLLRALGVYRIAGLVDDGLEPGETILGIPILGGAGILPELRSRGVRLAVNAVGGIGDVSVRIKVFQRLAEAGFACPAVAHPSALIEPSAVLAAGVQVFPHAYVGSDARVGFGTIVNTGSILSHDCVLEDYVNISPGAILAGAVQVGSGALIGMGVTINLEVRIGAGARIGNGATVKADVPEKAIVRAGLIWPS